MRVLLLGEGNFSFSLCLARRLSDSSPPATVVATSFDSRGELESKYADSFPHVLGQLQSSCIVKVLHAVDATRPLNWQLRPPHAVTTHGNNSSSNDDDEDVAMPDEFDHIIFNFPHLGKEDCAAHASMLGHIMHSAKSVMAPHATLYITLSQQQAQLWRIEEMGSLNGLCMMQSVAMNKDAWPQWELKRHHTGKSFESRVQDCRHYCLRVRGGGSRDGEANIFTMFSRAAAAAAPSTSSNSSNISSSISSSNNTVSEGIGAAGVTKAKLKKRKLFLLTDNGFLQENSGGWRCLRCNKLCKSEISVRDHVYSTHVLGQCEERVSGGYGCTFCKRNFADHGSLQQHIVSKHGLHAEVKPAWAAQGGAASEAAEELPPFACSICGVRFHTEAELALHCESGYQPMAACEKEEVCKVCQKCFADERSLKQHENYCLAKRQENSGDTGPPT